MLWVREAAKPSETSLQREDGSLTQSCRKELGLSLLLFPTQLMRRKERGEEAVAEIFRDPTSLTIAPAEGERRQRASHQTRD